MDSYVMTVRGSVAPEALGLVDAHNHLFIRRVSGAAQDAPVLNDESGVTAEARNFRALGGGTIVDCQPGVGCGRNGRVLARIARLSGLHVVASTGFHRRRYYGPDAPIFTLNAEQAAAHFLDEVNDGLVETQSDERPVYPGQIKIAAEATLAETPAALLEGAVAAAVASGYLLAVHTERGAAAAELAERFQELGLSLDRLVLCHMDKRPDVGLHRELALAGVLLEYDTFFRPSYQPEENLWPLIMQMVEAGLAHRIALATDMADPAMWRVAGGGAGLAGWFDAILPGLDRHGLNCEQIGLLTGENIANRLAIAGTHNTEVDEHDRHAVYI